MRQTYIPFPATQSKPKQGRSNDQAKGFRSERRLAWLALMGLLIPSVSTVSSAQTVTSYTYDALGRTTTASMDVGGTETFEYDDAGNIIRAIGIPAPTGSPPSCTLVLRFAFNSSFSIDGTTNCTDPDSDPLTVTAVTDPAGPVSTSLSGNTVTFTNLQVGQDVSVTVTITDGNGNFITNNIWVERQAGGLTP